MANLPRSVKDRMVEELWPELAQYEKGPQKEVPKTTNPFKGARPAATATSADIANAGALAPEGAPSRINDIAPGGAAAAGAAASDDAPVVDEDGTLGDQSVTGEGTSDDLTADPSTATGDPGTEADPNTDLTGEAVQEEPAAPAPAKGSAQERITELVDKLEGAMVFGKTVQEAYKATVEENARLRAERSTAAAAPATAAPPVAVSDDPGPMPDMADADISFDNDKYRAKMQEWSTKNARHQARALFQEMTGAVRAQTLMEKVETKVATFTKEHPEFKEVVTNNPVLKANQLASEAGAAVARSEYTAELLMKFGQDTDFAIRVAKMHPVDQLLIVGEMIADIKAEKKVGKATTTTVPTKQTVSTQGGGAQPAARKSVSQAPPPPTRTAGAGASKRFDPLDPNTSMDDFVREHRTGKETARQQNRRLRGLK